jgi:chromosome segregation ATPase
VTPEQIALKFGLVEKGLHGELTTKPCARAVAAIREALASRDQELVQALDFIPSGPSVVEQIVLHIKDLRKQKWSGDRELAELRAQLVASEQLVTAVSHERGLYARRAEAAESQLAAAQQQSPTAEEIDDYLCTTGDTKETRVKFIALAIQTAIKEKTEECNRQYDYNAECITKIAALESQLAAAREALMSIQATIGGIS